MLKRKIIVIVIVVIMIFAATAVTAYAQRYATVTLNLSDTSPKYTAKLTSTSSWGKSYCYDNSYNTVWFTHQRYTGSSWVNLYQSEFGAGYWSYAPTVSYSNSYKFRCRLNPSFASPGADAYTNVYVDP